MAKREKSKGRGKKVQAWKLYEVKGKELIRKRRLCPKCKNTLAHHKNRAYCGYCGFSELKK